MFKSNLKHIMGELEMSIEDLMDISQVSPDDIHALLNSDDEVKISKVLSISNALGVPTAVLFSWVKKEKDEI
jgi:transcriptional regulator with XRE-family HTH domain